MPPLNSRVLLSLFIRCLLVPPQLLQVTCPILSPRTRVTLLQRVVLGFPPPPPPYCTVEGDAGVYYVLMQAEGSEFRVLVFRLLLF